MDELLKNINSDFKWLRKGIDPKSEAGSPVWESEIEWYDSETQEKILYYGRQRALVIINYEPVSFYDTPLEALYYQHLNIHTIKNIYINEDLSIIMQYIYDPDGREAPIKLAKRYGCVVLIETYPNFKIPSEAAKGVRKTWLEGYSPMKEFYSPNYLALPPEPNDYRRTLYWNPNLTTDENGKAKVQFYNNSRCTNYSISAETVTKDGRIGIYSGD